MESLITQLDSLLLRAREVQFLVTGDDTKQKGALIEEVVNYLKTARVEAIKYKGDFTEKEKIVNYESNLMALLCIGWGGIETLSADINSSMLSSLPSICLNKLVDIFLVLVYNSCLNSLYRSQTLYTSSIGQTFILNILKSYPDMESNTREICDELIKNLLKEGLFHELFTVDKEVSLLSELQYEVLKTVCLSQGIREYAQYFPTTISIFSHTIDRTIELLKLCNNDPIMVESNSSKFQVLHEQLKIWLEWFYQFSDPETEHGLILRNNQELSLSLITLYISLINALHFHVPKIHSLKVANDITPSFLTLTGIMTCSIRALNNLIFQNTNAQDKVRELGGIPLILNQCNIDDNNPYLREHSIFAVHSLTNGNKMNANLVKALAPKGPAFNPVLDEMGLKNNLDNNGNPFLSRK